MLWLFNRRVIDAPKDLDIIEDDVYTFLKPLGFRKFGRTLHRFVGGDLSQVVNFQIWKDKFCVNLGIRIPECDERCVPKTDKKYYHEYECTLRSRLGEVRGKRETWFDLNKNPTNIVKKIKQELFTYVIPAYDILNSRESILHYDCEYPGFWSGCVLLDLCMIYLKMGDRVKAKECFERQYQISIIEYQDKMENGEKVFLKKGERVCYMHQEITAEKDGYVTVYGASHAHLDYLDELGMKLGFK